jgi:hypothetical protein
MTVQFFCHIEWRTEFLTLLLANIPSAASWKSTAIESVGPIDNIQACGALISDKTYREISRIIVNFCVSIAPNWPR